MRHDHRPYRVKRAFAWLERWYRDHRLAPQADAFGAHAMVLKPWHVRLHGSGIRIGRAPHIIAAADRPVALTTWSFENNSGRIDVGDYCLLCPGVRIDAAEQVTIGDNCMLAAGAYVTDADWHDLYDRTRVVGRHAPVVLEDNVWLGDGAMVCKGVRVGANSVVGARAVVTRDVPANSIVAGNPASVVRTLDTALALVRRADLLHDPAALDRQMDALDRYVLGGNGYARWLRSLLAPTRKD